VSFAQVLEAADAEIDRIEANEDDREAARGVLASLRGRAAEEESAQQGGTGAFLAGGALTQALGLLV